MSHWAMQNRVSDSLDTFRVTVMCSVPQGSLFFIMYMADLADRAVKYGVSLHAYADDTQLYLHFSRDEMA